MTTPSLLDVVRNNLKFFPRDVIGKKPEQVGDTFRAFYFGRNETFEVTEYREDMYIAKMI